jgi:hypothetical protein
MRLGLMIAASAAFAIACGGSSGSGTDDGPEPDALGDLTYDGVAPDGETVEPDAQPGDVGDLGPDAEPCAGTVTATGFRDHCDGTVTDTRTGLMWMRTSLSSNLTNQAMTLCNELVSAGYDDWRLPTIDELRGIVLGCDKTKTGGTCGVSNTCWEESCRTESACGSCGMKGGPGDQGCYTDPLLDDQCHLTLSQTKVRASYAGDVRSWYVTFYDGRLDVNPAGAPITTGFARCVRTPVE